MNSLKILHVIGQRPEKTGSGIYLQAVISESQKNGFQNCMVAGIPSRSTPDIVAIPPSNCLYTRFEAEDLPFPVTGMSDVMPYRSSLFRDLKSSRLNLYKQAFATVLEKAVDTFEPDIIHTHHLFVLTALTKKLFSDLPVVTTCHGTELRQYQNCPHLRNFVKKYCRRLDGVMALSHDQKMAIARTYDLPAARIAVTGGGYDETLFNRAPKPAAETVNILYAGKFNRPKGVPWLLKSLSAIKNLSWHLHMAGNGQGPEYDECLSLAEELGTRVTLHGQVTHCRLSQLMKQSHIQVLPSFFEGLPLVLFEGLASGCRIVTTNLSGFEETFGRTKPDTVKLLDLPPLESIDRPYQKDLPGLEKQLSAALIEMIASVRQAPDFDDPQADRIASYYTWQRVFERVMTVYLETV